jgi:5-methylcytosine-specific restriction protein A
MMKPLTVCLTPGCPELVPYGHCPKHRPEQHTEPYGQPWRRLRAKVLTRDKTCRNCGKPSEHADHVYPRSKGGPDTLTNTQGVCARCNLSKGARVP